MPNQGSTNAFQRYFEDARQTGTSSRQRRPWVLILLGLACAIAALVGSFGPWIYNERVTQGSSQAWIEYGGRTDGAFSALFAGVAIVSLLVVLVKPSAGFAAWVACVALALCAITGLGDWLFYQPRERSLEPGQIGEIVRIEWGLKLVGLAGATGAVVTFFAARVLNPD